MPSKTSGTVSTHNVNTVAGFLAEYDDLVRYYHYQGDICHSRYAYDGVYDHSLDVPSPENRTFETRPAEEHLNDEGKTYYADAEARQLGELREKVKVAILYAIRHNVLTFLSAKRCAQRLGLTELIQNKSYVLRLRGEFDLPVVLASTQREELARRLSEVTASTLAEFLSTESEPREVTASQDRHVYHSYTFMSDEHQ